MHAFDVLGDPVRRRILELLAEDKRSAGDIWRIIEREFGISNAAVSQHLKVLRENGFALSRANKNRRIYELQAEPLREVDDWLDPFRQFWTHKMEALATEVARAKKARGKPEP